MANEVLQGIADDISKISESIKQGDELISAAKEAGEDVSGLASDLSQLKIRRERWVRMLKGRGINVK